MARLSAPKPRLSKIRPRLVAPTDEAGRSRYRDATDPWRKWYKTARWQRLRWSVLVNARFTCAMCGRIEPDTSLLVGDHIRPHRGDVTLFWDEANIQCLCKACHDSAKQSAERSGRVRLSTGSDGWPRENGKQ